MVGKYLLTTWEESLYLFGIGAGETVGDGYLPAVGLDDDVCKEQSRFERDTANAITLDNRGSITNKASLVERDFLIVYLQLVGKRPRCHP